MKSGQQTEKARQVRAEKRTLEDVVRALQDLLGRDLAASADDPGSPESPAINTDTTGPVEMAVNPSSAATAPEPEPWDEDIPVLRDVVLAPPLTEKPPMLPSDAPHITAVVRRAAQTFNTRIGANGPALSPQAIELLEHLLFEEWIRTGTHDTGDEAHGDPDAP
ncbi:MAG: hypothetical protein ACYCP0_04010 [Acidiferrobacteraceae bacterium]